ncbi:aspartokinase [Caldalkalibacillus thermarum]|uniref:aspartate kinase n=1 Tax=Caldalkalibacillus thermarum TaxID=296745 RepID=UPI001663FBA8|nr:aspartate kinase [Caldalkalibacillus thermarum]GGK13300.1 aspartokinase [Caldalkalibacillus thermarum]
MKIIVQKFGGTSLKDKEIRGKAIQHIKKAREEGYHVVVVVSAMGRKGDPYATDTLLEWIKQNGNHLSDREKDLLLSCGEIISSATLTSMLNAQGIPAVALTGFQAGILTNDTFGQAQIISVNPQRILDELAKNKVVVVCGFQGGTAAGEITTLGRGGSDTTATALGVALKAEYVDIFTDVDGIMTADPRIVEDAAPLNWVTYTEICNLAYQGAKVIHPRAVEIAMQSQVPIRVRSTMSDDPGTLVTTLDKVREYQENLNERLITGIAYVPNLTQIKVLAKEHEYDLQLKVFKAMAENKISVDFINVNPMGVAYTVFNDVADQAISLIKEMEFEVQVEPHCAKVSIVGAGMAGVPGIMAQIVEALTQEDIQILQSADSHTTIWVLVKDEDMIRAVNALHRKFNLHKLNQQHHRREDNS